MNRREFITSGAAMALAGCTSVTGGKALALKRGVPRFHVFSKMFQSPVTSSPEALCDLMAAAGMDGVQWTVRPKGHVLPEAVKTELPRLVRIAEARGLKCESICTAITDGRDPIAETIAKTAADCGIRMFRTGYYFYDLKRETFGQSMDRIKRGFASLAELGERSKCKAVYQNHSSWGPSVFGGVVWDDYECLKDHNPEHVGLEFDPMHAYYETNLSWTHGFDLVARWIASLDLKDFHYILSPKNPKMMKKSMVGAGEGIVPWKDVRKLVDAHGVDPLYIVHFEYNFDKTDLTKTVRNELSYFKKVFG